MNRSEKALLALILSGGGLLTFFYLYQFQQTPYGRFLMVDAKVYHQKALQILQEGWLGKGVFYQAPLYPYILAGIYKIFGVHSWVVQAIQGGLFLLTVTLLFQIGKTLFDPRTGLLSAALAVLYGPFTYYSGLLLKESWSIFFTAGLLLLLIKAARARNNRLFYGAGLLLGVNLALRENYFLVLIALGLWTLSFGPSAGPPVSPSWTARAFSRLRPALFLILGVFTCLAPFMIRNYVHSGDLILTSYQAGANFYIGNNPQARGFYTRLNFVRANPEFEEVDFRSRAERIMGRSLSPSEVSRFWFRQGLQAFRDDPWLFPKLLGLKLFLFAHNYEIPDNYDYAFMRAADPRPLCRIYPRRPAAGPGPDGSLFHPSPGPGLHPVLFFPGGLRSFGDPFFCHFPLPGPDRPGPDPLWRFHGVERPPDYSEAPPFRAVFCSRPFPAAPLCPFPTLHRSPGFFRPSL